MANKMKKSALIKALKTAGIEFPASATVETLQQLYASVEKPGNCSRTPTPSPDNRSRPPSPNPEEDFRSQSPNSDHQFPLPSLNHDAVSRAPSLNHIPDTIPSSSLPVVTVPCQPIIEASFPIPEDVPDRDSIDDELLRLRKMVEIARLRAELQKLEMPCETTPVNRRRLEFQDVEYSLQKFTGDDSYRVVKWVNDFEEILDSGRVDERDKLIFARRMMDGTARKFLTTIHTPNWSSFRAQLVGEFGRCRSRHEVYVELSHRTIRRNETAHQYIIEMQSIAAHTDISESELVQFILDGFGDIGPSGTFIYNANTLAELKESLTRYEHRRTRPFLNRAPVQHRIPHPTTITSRNLHVISTNGPSVPVVDASRPVKEQNRCSNCRTLGHHESTCLKPRRPAGSCFNCWETGHWHRDCPRRRRVNIAATVQEDQPIEIQPESVDNPLTEELSATQTVSISFNVDGIGCSNESTFLSLFDTGSPVSFIRKSAVPPEHQSSQLTYTKYQGLGNAKLFSYGNPVCHIKFQSQICSNNILVVPDHVLPIPILIGRDFLKKFGISLYRSMPSTRFNNNKKKTEIINPVVATVHHTNKLMKSKHKSYYCASNLIDRLLMRPDIDLPFVPESHGLIDKNLKPKVPPFNLFNELPYAMVTEPELSYLEEINISHHFGVNYYDKCQQLVHDYFTLKSRPYKTAPVQHSMKIRLTTDTPFYCSPRRLSYKEKDEVTKVIEDLSSRNIIRPSCSPYASPIVLVRKKNGEMRMCIDYRSLNKITVRDNFPLPLIDDCLEYLDSKHCFSLIDLKNGFHHVTMDPDSIPYTSFVTPYGQFEYVQMPFGLRNGPSVFQRFITTILHEMIMSREIVVYMDDILVATVTPEEHLKVLSKLLNRLAEYKLEIKLNKCRLLQSSVDYLGYLANSHGIKPNSSHVETIRNYPTPTTAREVQSCLGLFSYFRRFVPSFSRIAAPLLNILRKDTVFKFDSDCSKAFSTLRDALVSAPVLSIYNPNRETELHTDASSHGFGAVLLQKQEDNKWHPVSYYSRRTTPAESKYHSFELETLAVIYALRRFRVYVEGRPFRIVTDCNSFAQTLSKKTLNPRIARWALELENYNYTIIHRKGTDMGHVDALSRPPLASLIYEHDSDLHSLFVQNDDIDFYLHATQSRDPVLTGIRQQLQTKDVDPYEMSNGLVYRRMSQGHLALCVPFEMETHVIRLIHEKIGHLAKDKCYDQISLHYWFPSMHRKIQDYIQNCIRCIIHNPPRHINERTLHSIPKEPVPFDTVHIDHFGPLPNVLNKNKHILVIIDSFTKYVKLYPVNTTSTKEVCSALEKYFSYYSRPRRLVSDRGTAFTSSDFANYLSDQNILHVKNAVAAPQANGQVERVNRVLSRMLSKLSEPVKQSDWSRMLNKVEYAINNSVQSSTKQSASMLLFGVRQRGLEADELTEYLDEQQSSHRSRDLENLRTNADIAIKSSQQKNEIQYAKRSVPPRKYSKGDYVVIRNVDTTVGANKKLIPKYRGPYIIYRVLPNDRYHIRDIENCQITQIPYQGTLEAARLRPWTRAEDDSVDWCSEDDEINASD